MALFFGWGEAQPLSETNRPSHTKTPEKKRKLNFLPHFLLYFHNVEKKNQKPRRAVIALSVKCAETGSGNKRGALPSR